jgi:hypothetical protein
MFHFTVRRWFIALVGFGAVTLYGLWVYYGAAPRSFASGEGQIETRVDGAGHGGVHEGTSPHDVLRVPAPDRDVHRREPACR